MPRARRVTELDRATGPEVSGNLHAVSPVSSDVDELDVLADLDLADIAADLDLPSGEALPDPYDDPDLDDDDTLDVPPMTDF